MCRSSARLKVSAVADEDAASIVLLDSEEVEDDLDAAAAAADFERVVGAGEGPVVAFLASFGDAADLVPSFVGGREPDLSRH